MPGSNGPERRTFGTTRRFDPFCTRWRPRPVGLVDCQTGTSFEVVNARRRHPRTLATTRRTEGRGGLVMAEYVLFGGGWIGGWCWQPVGSERRDTTPGRS